MNVQNPNFLFGVHIPPPDFRTVRAMILLGLNAFQSSFLDAFGGVDPIFLPFFEPVRRLLLREKKYLCIHGCIRLNLVGSKDFVDFERKKFRVKTIITEELDAGVALGCGVVFHTGSCVDRKRGLKVAIRNVKEFLDSKSKITDVVARQLEISSDEVISRRKFILENSAGAGDCFGNTLEEMEEFIDGIDDKRLKICLDTAHLFGAGYDVSDPKVVKEIFSHSKIIDLLEVIHLNDSKVPCGSRKDRHEIIGQGKIWSKNTESLELLLRMAHERGIACVGEPPRPKSQDSNDPDPTQDYLRVASELVPDIFYE